MKDIFYTILVVWIVWRIFSSINAYKARQTASAGEEQKRYRKPGETTVDYVPPSKKQKKKDDNDDEGEYVDYEEIK
jgi:hypothetical protein